MTWKIVVQCEISSQDAMNNSMMNRSSLTAIKRTENSNYVAGKILKLRKKLQVAQRIFSGMKQRLTAYSKLADRIIRILIITIWIIAFLQKTEKKMTWKIVVQCEIMAQDDRNNSMMNRFV